MHAAIVKRRAFWSVFLVWHRSRCLMGDVEDRKLSDFPLLNEAPDFVMIPSVPIKKIHCHQPIVRLNLAQQGLLFRNALRQFASRR